LLNHRAINWTTRRRPGDCARRVVRTHGVSSRRAHGTVLQIDDERIEVVGGDGGEPRGLALCKSEDDVRALLRGDLDAIVAALLCVRHLMSDDLYSGWGVRTMGASEGSYNPIGYHVGTVWPHDNSIIAWGLRRYGYRAEAARICRAMLEAASLFNGRLPEAFSGYARENTHYPMKYPTACNPQAWTTGAPLLAIRTLLGLDSDGRHLIIDPALVDPLGQLELLDIPGVWGHMDAFGRARSRTVATAALGEAAP